MVEANDDARSAETDYASSEIGIIARLFQSCTDILSNVVKDFRRNAILSKRDLASLRRSVQSMIHWGDSHDIMSGHLDSKLQKSRRLRDTTVDILRNIGVLATKDMRSVGFISRETLAIIDDTEIAALLEKVNSLIQEARQKDGYGSDRESDTDDELEESSYGNIIAELAGLTRNLIDLNSALDNAIIDPEYISETPAPPTDLALAPHQFYSNCIREKFPGAAGDLIEYLGKANLERYQYILAQKESVNEVNEGIVVKEVEREQGAPTFRDSGIGTSLQKSAYAPTLVSSLASTETGGEFKYPPLPEGAKAGSPFECDGCGRQVVITTRLVWRKHLISDIKPYSCFFPPCKFSKDPFNSRMDWARHMQLEHSEQVLLQAKTCPLCHEPGPAQMNVEAVPTVLLHLAKHLEEIAAQALPRAVESDASSVSIPEDPVNGLDDEAFEEAINKFVRQEDFDNDLPARGTPFATSFPLPPTYTSCHSGQNNPDLINPSADKTIDTSVTSSPTSPRSQCEGRDHEFYRRRMDPVDGLYHCPMEADGTCDFPPKGLKCEYHKHIDSHLKPFRCRKPGCLNQQFSSVAARLRHEREMHKMHNAEEFLCRFDGPCERKQPGNGFARSFNRGDHEKRVHHISQENTRSKGPNVSSYRRARNVSSYRRGPNVSSYRRGPNVSQYLASLNGNMETSPTSGFLPDDLGQFDFPTEIFGFDVGQTMSSLQGSGRPEIHKMHNAEEFLCRFDGPCERKQPGQGFARSFNRGDHEKQIHHIFPENSDFPPDDLGQFNASIEFFDFDVGQTISSLPGNGRLEMHKMHNAEEFLCRFDGPCERKQPGQGFARSFNRGDHEKRVHHIFQENTRFKGRPKGASSETTNTQSTVAGTVLGGS